MTSLDARVRPGSVQPVDEILIATIPWGSSVFEVSPAYRDRLEGCSKNGDAAAIDEELERLERLGFLVAPGSVRRRERTRTLTLHLVHGCNLGCTYCNVKQGTYGERRQLMSFETARAALERFTAPGTTSDVGLFGGEPTLNWPVLVKLVEHGRSLSDRKINFGLVTNGTTIDEERARTLARLGVIVVVSVDGDRADHDRNRKTLAGEGSYDLAVRGVGALVGAGVEGRLHATHDGRGASYMQRYDHLVALGRGRLPVVIGSSDPARTTGFGREEASFGARLRSAWREGERGVPTFLRFWVNAVACGERGERMDCGAGSSAVSVTPAGDVFACHIAAAGKEYKLGSLSDEVLPVLDPLGGAPLPRACSSCWANGLCSHGCPILRSRGVEPSEGECESYREPVRCAAYFLAVARIEDLAGFWATDEGGRTRVGRAWAVREAVRARHRHVRPLAVFPTPAA